MAKKKYEETDGVWRTVGGRRIFIRTGQSLSSAMKESGKFGKEKYIVGKGKDKDTHKILAESKDSIGETIYKIEEDGKEKWVQGEHFKEYDPHKGTPYEKKYDSVEDRYNRDKDFRDMLKGEHEKTLKATRGEINSYFDLENRDEEIGNKDDLYKMINENYYNVSKEDFEKIYSEEASARYNKADKEWQKLSKKMEKDYDEYGTNNYKDVSKLNKLSRDRDYYSLYSSEKNKIRYTADEEDILNRYSKDYGYDGKDRLSNLKGQIDYMRNPGESINRTAQRLVEGGDFLIANEDMKKYLKERNIKFNDDNVFDKYKVEMAGKIEGLYNQASLKDRYSGTVDYLKDTTNMSGAEILELLKRIDEDKR